eukprot:jgi/Bigna1/77520/fgenesh1_pg.48_\
MDVHLPRQLKTQLLSPLGMMPRAFRSRALPLICGRDERGESIVKGFSLALLSSQRRSRSSSAPSFNGSPSLASIKESLERNALLFPNKVAVSDGRIKLTNTELFERSLHLARLFREHFRLEAGAHVSFASSNRSECIEVYAACGMAGVVCAPVNCVLEEKEMSAVFSNSKPKVVFVEESLLEKVCKALRISSLKHIKAAPFGRHQVGGADTEVIVWGDQYQSLMAISRHDDDCSEEGDCARNVGGEQVGTSTCTDVALKDRICDLDESWLCLHSSG